MALVKFTGIGVRAISVAVPKTRLETISRNDFFTQDQLSKFAELTGVNERRISDCDTCSSDLCYAAANNLFNKTGIDPGEVDALIFISQTPDYKIPGTSIILQHKLGLSKGTLAFDVNLTCSGYVYGLFLAYSLVRLPEIRNVLLLVGETLSKIISPKDKSTGLLLGDAGSATLIKRSDDFGESFFSLNTDGTNHKSVMIPAGGYRKMSSVETLRDTVFEDGSIRNEEQLAMDGMDVFSFAVSEMPKDIKRLLDFSGKDLSQVDKFVFHQANKFMMDFIAKKLKLDKQKMLYSIQNFGNTSGVSIPLTLAYQRSQINNYDMILLNAIGAGFSYGTLLFRLNNCHLLEIIEI